MTSRILFPSFILFSFLPSAVPSTPITFSGPGPVRSGPVPLFHIFHQLLSLFLLHLFFSFSFAVVRFQFRFRAFQRGNFLFLFIISKISERNMPLEKESCNSHPFLFLGFPQVRGLEFRFSI